MGWTEGQHDFAVTFWAVWVNGYAGTASPGTVPELTSRAGAPRVRPPGEKRGSEGASLAVKPSPFLPVACISARRHGPFGRGRSLQHGDAGRRARHQYPARYRNRGNAQIL